MPFTHLHVHSHYSLLDGLPKIDELVAAAQKNNMNAMALTDHGVMYGIIEFYQKCKKNKIKPILGMEAYIAPNGLHSKRPKIDEKPYHLILLAKNSIGYQNLLKLNSIAHLEGFYYKPRLDLDLLQKYKEGLIVSSACLQGEVPRAIIAYSPETVIETINKYIQIFTREDFYLEVQYHPHIPEQQKVNDAIFKIAKEMNIKVIATNDVHYINPEDAEEQDVLLCIQTKKELSNANRMTMRNDDFSFHSEDKIKKIFSNNPEVIFNTQEIADKCNVEISLGKIQLPHYELPNGITDDQELKKLCDIGLKKRFNNNISPKITERLNYELEVITKTGYASYFLIVQDFVNWAKKNKIVVGPGRGSAAGSIVSYLTNITDIDPIKYDLLFERFLNPDRVSMPDIDMDFADKRRDEVINYVEKKYGKDHVAQIITFGTMAARAAVRDVGRVMGIAYSYCDKLAKMIPMFMDLTTAINTVPEVKDIYQNDPDAVRLLNSAKKLEGVARHASTHACGVVITDLPLDHYTPLQYASQSDRTIITQYSLHPIEDLGLLKMDFLGLKNLSIIEDTINIIRLTTNQEINTENIPLDDKKTYQLLKQATTTGVFQLESSGMKRYLKELQPTEFEDIIAMVALYRPGPMEWIPDYINGKKKKAQPKYLHDKLKKILDKTYGVAIYQEQIMQIARDLAGFTLGEADVLRKAVAKKIPELLAEQKNKFIAGCIKNNISKNIAEKIFNFIEPFAGYGFNRSHAACYAMIAYQTAYLKAHWPAQFLAALMTSDYGDTDRIAIEVQEAAQLGIEIMPPDINESFSTFTVIPESIEKKQRIRFGLAAIKNVGSHIVDVLIKERKNNGQFKNLEDFLSRIQDKDLNKKSLESMIKAGALDKFDERSKLLTNIETLLNFSKLAQEEKENGQINIFGNLPVRNAPKLFFKNCPEADSKQKLIWEKELLGLYISSHPLAEYENIINNIAVPLSEIKYLVNENIKVIGVLTNIKKIFTRNGDPMAFANIEDRLNSCEILVFPKIYQQYNHLLFIDNIIIIEGKISNKDGEHKIIAETISLFNPENIPLENKHKIQITLPNTLSKAIADKLKQVISEKKGQYHVEILANDKIINTKMKTSISIIKKIASLIGKKNIKIL